MWCNVGYAKIGDVYYCVMDQIAKTNAEGSTSFKTQKLNSILYHSNKRFHC